MREDTADTTAKPARTWRDYLQGTSRGTLALGVVLSVLMLVLYWRVYQVFAARWFGSSDYYHCLAVPPLVAWLVWRRRERLAEAPVAPSTYGIIVLAAGLLIAVMGTRVGINLAVGCSLPVVIAGLVMLIHSSRALRILLVPLLTSCLVIAPPKHALARVTMPMQVVSAATTEYVARVALGIPVTREGVALDVRGFEFIVADACSGMSSLLALTLTTLFLLEVSSLPRLRKLVAVAMVPGIVLIANVTRICMVLLISEYVSPEVALGDFVHGAQDVVVYLAALISMALLLNALTPFEPVAEGEETDEPSQ